MQPRISTLARLTLCRINAVVLRFAYGDSLWSVKSPLRTNVMLTNCKEKPFSRDYVSAALRRKFFICTPYQEVSIKFIASSVDILVGFSAFQQEEEF